MKYTRAIIQLLSIAAFLYSANVTAQVEQIDDLQPILLDKEALSGVGLKKITLRDTPDRAFFQKNLYRGSDLSVYVVSSQSWPSRMDNFSIDEYIYMLNGKARVKPDGGEDLFFQTGDFFAANKSYTGEWEIIAGDQYHYELSCITTKRADTVIHSKTLQPQLLNRDILSGTSIVFDDEGLYETNLFVGDELLIKLKAEQARTQQIANSKEYLISILSGKIRLTDIDGTASTFYTGDHLIIPQGYTGQWQSEGHGMLKYICVEKAEG